MNIENMKKLRDFLAGLGEDKFQMESWLDFTQEFFSSEFDYTLIPTKENHHGWTEIEPLSGDCGTVGCIGGWCMVMIAKEKDLMFLIRDGSLKAVNGEHFPLYEEEVAGDWLGLTDEQRHQLFYAQNGPRYMDEIRLEHALKVLDHAIETGNIDWSENVVPIEEGDKASRRDHV